MKKLFCCILAVVFAFTFCDNIYASDQSTKATVISAKYKNLWPLSSTGSDACAAKVPLFKFQKGKYYGVINDKGKVIADAVYNSIGSYQNGYLLVAKDKKFGFISNKGKVITKLRYDYSDGFHDGLARVKLNNKFGFINTSGKEIISIKYDNAFNYVDGIAPICTDGKWGLIDQKGNYILEPKYAQIGYTYGDENEIEASFADGIAPAKDFSGKWGYIDETGKEIIPPQFDAAYSSKNGFAAFVKNGKMGLATNKGIVLDPVYDNIGEFDKSGITWFSQDNMIGLINSDMKVIAKAAYTLVSSVSPDGYYTICQNNKWGAVDKNGTAVIEPQYDKMGYFYHGLAYVVIDGKIGYINSKNELVIPAKYKKTTGLDSDFTFGNAIVNQSGKYGMINSKGSFIVKPVYHSITKDVSSKLYITQLGSKYGVLDANGKVILKPVYSDIRINNGIICAFSGTSARLYSANGKKITKNSYGILTVNYASLSDTCMAYIYKAHGKYGAIIVRTK